MVECKGVTLEGYNIPAQVKNKISGLPRTMPLYYDSCYIREFDSRVLKIISCEDKFYVVSEKTCFFPEGGGQPSDIGLLYFPNGQLKVVDTQAVDDIILHIAVPVSGHAREGELVHGIINWNLRYNMMKHHTCSHLLFSSIKRVIGLEKLVYKGVQIGDKKARIDVSYGKPISSSQLMEIETLSNKVCFENRKVKSWLITREEAEHIYGKELGVTDVTPSGVVHVVEIEGWDVSLCCGTHVSSTAEVGLVKVLDRFRLQKGVERIEFSAGEYAYKHYKKAMQTLNELTQTLKTPTENIVNHVSLLLKEKKLLKEKIEKIRDQLADFQATELLEQAKVFGEFRFLTRNMKDADAQSLKRVTTTLTNKNPWLIIILGSKSKDKAFIIGAAGQKAVEKGINMYDIMKMTAKMVGGGGGTAKIAQAGGKNPDLLDQALRQCSEAVLSKLRNF